MIGSRLSRSLGSVIEGNIFGMSGSRGCGSTLTSSSALTRVARSTGTHACYRANDRAGCLTPIHLVGLGDSGSTGDFGERLVTTGRGLHRLVGTCVCGARGGSLPTGIRGRYSDWDSASLASTVRVQTPLHWLGVWEFEETLDCGRLVSVR